MGASLVLKNADFSDNGFPVDLSIVDYWKEDITQQVMPISVSGTYSGCVVLKTKGSKFNYVRIEGNNPNDFYLCKYNETAKQFTVIGTLSPSSDYVAELLLNEPLQLSNEEMIGFKQITPGTRENAIMGYPYTTDQGDGEVFDYILESNGERAHASSWLYKKPKMVVELKNS